MPLPKRLQQTVKKLSPQQLQALQALLDQLIRQKEPSPAGTKNVPGEAVQAKPLDLPPRVRQVRQARLLLR
jgi:hypothetical protein